MSSLYIICMEINFELICYRKQYLFTVISVILSFFHTIKKNYFPSYVLLLSTKLKGYSMFFRTTSLCNCTFSS